MKKLYEEGEKYPESLSELSNVARTDLAFFARDYAEYTAVIARGNSVYEYAFFYEDGECAFSHLVTPEDHPEPRSKAVSLALAQMWYDNCDVDQQDLQIP